MMGRVIICVGTAGVGDARGGLRIVCLWVSVSRYVCVGMCIFLVLLNGGAVDGLVMLVYG